MGSLSLGSPSRGCQTLRVLHSTSPRNVGEVKKHSPLAGKWLR